MSEGRGRRGVPAGRRGTIQPGTGTGRGRAGRGRAMATPTPSEASDVQLPARMSAGHSDDGQGQSSAASDISSVATLTESIGNISLSLRQRPGYGTQGRPIGLMSNHFPVLFKNGQIVVQHYRIEISHERRKLFKQDVNTAFWMIVARNKQTFQNPYSIVFDGGNMAFCTETLIFPDGSNKQYTWDKIDGILLPHDDRPVELKCFISLVGSVHIDPKKVASGQDREQTPIQVIDVVFRQGRNCPYNQIQNPLECLVPASQCFFFPPDPRADMQHLDLTRGRVIWDGMFMSARVAQGWKPLMNIDASQTAFYKSSNCIKFCQEVLSAISRDQRDRENWDPNYDLDPGAFLDDRQRNVMNKELRTLRVQVRTFRAGEANAPDRTFKVAEVSKESAHNLMFTLRPPVNGNGNGAVGQERELSVAQYFEQVHHHQLTYPHMPCLKVGNKHKNIFMPMEICTLLIGQKSNCKLSEMQTSKMIRHACRPAPERQQRIMNAMMRAPRLDQDQWITQFGLKIDTNMVKFNGRVLQAPILEYGNGRTAAPREGQWRSDGLTASQTSDCSGWGIIALHYHPRSGETTVRKFAQTISQACVAYGVGLRENNFNQRIIFMQQGTNVQHRLTQEMQQFKDEGCTLLIVLVESKTSMYYPDIKRVSEIDVGIMTQCIVYKNIERPGALTLNNIALKINAKLGGQNQVLKSSDPWRNALYKIPTLILGIDVTHAGPGDEHTPSVATLVGNVDLFGNVYTVTPVVQKFRREQMIDLCSAVRERLLAFFNATKCKPARIIVYRDGVSEGQFKQVLRAEMMGIRKACMTIDATYKPPITFIVVQKRHHTRFFCQNPRDASGKAQNVPAGTLVDNTITHPEDFDFYLCSHFGIQGVSKPAHYYVLHDDSEFDADQIQMFTWYLTHVYTRCPRSVSIPAPVYYADLACTRARSHLASFGVDNQSDSISETTASGSAAAGAGDAEGDTGSDNSTFTKVQNLQSVIKSKMYYV